MKINQAGMISTKKGDTGKSRNYSNEEFSKDDILFETIGTIDELSSLLGVAYHYHPVEDIKTIQFHLQQINSQIATSPNHANYSKIKQLSIADLEWLETTENRSLVIAPIDAKFVLPGSEGSIDSAYYDLARAVSRRAERRLVHYVNETKRQDLVTVMAYMNRLSDHLYVLARRESNSQTD